ncbi:mitochondrial peripheral inner membrane protein [Exophiala xenobiotica]|nr:mitochondrial peripheral inner membrane protein [Exophiala xenobiotica]
MFARCSTGAPRSLRHASNPSPLRPLVHYNYSTAKNPQQTTPDVPRSRLSKRSLFVAAWAALTIVGGWQVYKYSIRKSDAFVAYTLVSKEPVSSTASIFHLEPSKEALASPNSNFELYKDAWRRGIWNVHFKQPQLQIVRAYTPLPPPIVDESTSTGRGKENDDELLFLIRKDPHGEVSSYLHRLPIGAAIEMRGPNLEYELKPDVRQVVFFAGGTGIAPALQVAHALFECGNDKSTEGDNGKDKGKGSKKLHILWANRMREECQGGVSDAPPEEAVPPKATWSGLFSTPKPKKVLPPPIQSHEKGLIVKELEALKQKYPGQVTVEYFVNAEDTWIDEDAVFRALSRFDDKDFSVSAATGAGSTALVEQKQILISGPPGFISYLAGPKEWRNGREEQGSVSKILAHAIAKNPHYVKVWKI